MIYGSKISQYKKTNVETATGLDLVVMCYEHAIRFIKQARDHYEKKEYMEKARALQKSLDIIGELKCSLDFDKGGEIAQNLDSIYNFLIKSLLQADIERNLEVFDYASKILSELKETWEAVRDNPLASHQITDRLGKGDVEGHLRVNGDIAA